MQENQTELRGLSSEEVRARVEAGKVNTASTVKTKSVRRIFYDNICTVFNLINVLLFVALLLFAVFRKREGWFPLLAPCSAAVLCYAVQAFFSFSVCLVAPMFWVLLGLSFNEQG